MNTIHQRNFNKQRKSSGSKKRTKYMLYGVAALIILLFFTGPRSVFQLISASFEKKRLNREIYDLEQKKAELDSIRIELQTNPQVIEKIAREEYNMKKKGEKVYKIHNDPK